MFCISIGLDICEMQQSDLCNVVLFCANGSVEQQHLQQTSRSTLMKNIAERRIICTHISYGLYDYY